MTSGSALSPSRTRAVVSTIGALQILSWGTSFYLLGVLAPPIAQGTGWGLPSVVAGLSIALLTAGLISPTVGRTIQKHGGRPVLAASSLLFSIGLAVLAIAHSVYVYWVAWIVLGAAMGSGLYDPAFATLGRQFGQAARRMITTVTLFGGFASTIGWPATAYFLQAYGWRTTCLIYATLHLLIGLPLYLLALPRQPPAVVTAANAAPGAAELPADRQLVAMILLGAILTIGAATLSLVGMHLLTLLQATGVSLAVAVSLGALVGPSQVGARVLELMFGRRYHPVWTMLAGAICVLAGMIVLWLGWPITALALIIYGAGNGISSIVRGTVPLVLFGSSRYAVLMGRLGLPILLAMAVAPTLGAILIEAGGARLTFGVVSASAALNVMLVLILAKWCR